MVDLEIWFSCRPQKRRGIATSFAPSTCTTEGLFFYYPRSNEDPSDRLNRRDLRFLESVVCIWLRRSLVLQFIYELASCRQHVQGNQAENDGRPNSSVDVRARFGFDGCADHCALKPPQTAPSLCALEEQEIRTSRLMVADGPIRRVPPHVAGRSFPAVPIDSLFVETVPVKLASRFFRVKKQHDRFPDAGYNSSVTVASETTVEFRPRIDGPNGERTFLWNRLDRDEIGHFSSCLARCPSERRVF